MYQLTDGSTMFNDVIIDDRPPTSGLLSIGCVVISD
jgi:hypothetical protein